MKFSIERGHLLMGATGFLVVFVLATVFGGGQEDTPTTMVSVTPQEDKEVCFDMLVRDEIRYEFKSDQPVAFNIHYHDGPAVQYPVQLNKVTEISDSFVADVSQSYCLMWSNQATGRTTLFYKVDRP